MGSREDLAGESEGRRLSKEESIEMMHFLAHTILKAYNLKVLRIAMTEWMNLVMASPDWQAFLTRLKEEGISGADDIKRKREELLGVEWDGLFKAADVGNSGKLSWETQQFRVFVKAVFEKAELPELVGSEEVNKKMFDTFAPEGSDIITKTECHLMVETVMDAVCVALSQ